MVEQDELKDDHLHLLLENLQDVLLIVGHQFKE